jgi:hypothetical protein
MSEGPSTHRYAHFAKERHETQTTRRSSESPSPPMTDQPEIVEYSARTDFGGFAFAFLRDPEAAEGRREKQMHIQQDTVIRIIHRSCAGRY